MNKCLVTKLNGSSNNSELLRLGEMRMQILKVLNPTEHTQGFSIGAKKAIPLEIVSDGYFTDRTLTENKGKNITLNVGMNSIWVNGNSDVEIAILDKYSLEIIKFFAYIGEVTPFGENIKFDISDLKYSNALTTLELPNSQVSGDIASLKSLTALTTLELTNSQVSGDIASLKSLTALTILCVHNQLKPLTGDIGQLSALSNCTDINIKYSTLTGDLALLPPKCRFASFWIDKGSVFTWSARPSTSKIMAIEGNAKLINIDKMLQDQAQCQVGISSDDPIWFKTIQITGNRTSASDEAIATLQQKGYTVSITPA